MTVSSCAVAVGRATDGTQAHAWPWRVLLVRGRGLRRDSVNSTTYAYLGGERDRYWYAFIVFGITRGRAGGAEPSL
jgi:hypothetical protein